MSYSASLSLLYQTYILHFAFRFQCLPVFYHTDAENDLALDNQMKIETHTFLIQL